VFNAAVLITFNGTRTLTDAMFHYTGDRTMTLSTQTQNPTATTSSNTIFSDIVPARKVINLINPKEVL